MTSALADSEADEEDELEGVEDNEADGRSLVDKRRSSSSVATSTAATYTPSSIGAAGSYARCLSQGGSASGSRRSSLMLDDATPLASHSVYSRKGKMLFKLGSRGADAGNFTWPRGVAVGQAGLAPLGRSEIIVADSSNHRVQVFDYGGRFLNEFGSYGSAPGQFDCLAGVAINRCSKNYVISDRYNHRIQVFDMAGRFVRSFGEHGREQAKFNLPWGVACDSRLGTVYVCDKENHRVQVFDIDGRYLSRFGSNGAEAGQMQHPHYIAAGLGRIVLTDTNNHRVQVFDSSGRLMRTIGQEGSARGQFKFPRGVAMDETGHIIVGDSGNNRLQIFNPEGIFIKAIGTWGSAEGEFKGIEGVAVDSASNNILVCDRENHRIQVF